MRKPTRTEPHPLGGTVSFFDLTNGLHVSVLDDQYLGPDIDIDFELHERTADGAVIQYTEQRAADWAGIHLLIDEIEAR
jgi:hypothetical protein